MLPSKEVTETATSIKMINSLLSHLLTYFEDLLNIWDQHVKKAPQTKIMLSYA